MSWLCLRIELQVEANSLAQAGDEFPPKDWVDPAAQARYRARTLLKDWLREYELTKDARALARIQAADERPPCPHCGKPVTRMTQKGTLPKYCSEKCAKTARQQRWRRSKSE